MISTSDIKIIPGILDIRKAVQYRDRKIKIAVEYQPWNKFIDFEVFPFFINKEEGLQVHFTECDIDFLESIAINLIK